MRNRKIILAVLLIIEIALYFFPSLVKVISLTSGDILLISVYIDSLFFQEWFFYKARLDDAESNSQGKRIWMQHVESAYKEEINNIRSMYENEKILHERQKNRAEHLLNESKKKVFKSASFEKSHSIGTL